MILKLASGVAHGRLRGHGNWSPVEFPCFAIYGVPSILPTIRFRRFFREYPRLVRSGTAFQLGLRFASRRRVPPAPLPFITNLFQPQEKDL